MAEVGQRSWKVPGQRTKREAWGYTTQVPCSPCPHRHEKPGAVLHPDGVRQVRSYKAEWTKDDAEKALAAALLQVGVEKPKSAGPTLEQASERYLAAKSRKDSLPEDQRILGHLKEHFGKDTPLAEITASRISEYKDKRLATVRTIGKGEAATERRLSVASVNRPLALLRCLLRLARDEWEVITKAPRMKLDREPRRMRWLKPEETVRLLDACRQSKNTDLSNLVEFCMFTGTRRGEALGLTWARVDRARGVVVLDAEQTKTDEPREVRLNDHSDAVLARRWKDARSTCSTARTGTATARRGRPPSSARSSPTSASTTSGTPSWLVQKGRPLKEVQEALGHKTLTMTLRYAHLAPDNLRAAAASLNGILQPANEPTEV